MGLNSTSEVPAKMLGVWPGPTEYASPPTNSSSPSAVWKTTLPSNT